MVDLAAHDLSVFYGHRPILHHLDFQAQAGAITVIAGPNGSGKSTLIKAISGEIPYRGSVAINGCNLASLKTRQIASMRAVLPQETSVVFPYTVAEVVLFGLEAGAMGRTQRTASLIEAALHKVGLAGFSHRLVSALSGGERQRVQLARVLCQIWEPVGETGPRWLIMDEPVASLDIKHQISLMDIARDFARQGGGVIAVMHDLNLSALYGDKLVLMKQGRIASEGTPASVLTTSMLSTVFECDIRPNHVPQGVPFVLPHPIL
jgi:iron complex transport system ATP-binding protein